MKRFALTIACAFVFVLTFTPSLSAQKKPKPGPRWMKMELGPVFSSTIKDVSKGIAIRIGENDEVGVLYDEDTMRMAYAWTGGFVNIGGGRDGLLANDNIQGKQMFKTSKLPGWSNTPAFKDPRPKPFGPVPHDMVQYKGQYRHGGDVVLSMLVGKERTPVLEMPDYALAEGITAVARTFNVQPHKNTFYVMLAEGKIQALESGEGRIATATIEGRSGAVALVGDGAKFVVDDVGVIRVAIQPSKQPQRIKAIVWVSNDKKEDPAKISAFTKMVKASDPPIDLSKLTKGGPRTWKQTLTTESTVGKGKGPYVIDTINPPFDNPWNAILHFGGMDFFSNGDIAVCTMEGDVYLVKGVKHGSDLGKVTWQRIATGMYHPLGLKIVDDKIYLLCRDQLAKLHDLNGDNEIDFYECYNNDVHTGFNSHEFATCLETDPEGNFMFIKGTNGGQTMHDSSVLKISKDGSKLERFATGFRWPNGFGMSEDGVITAADQQGTWIPSSRVDIVKRGGFYGFMNSHHLDPAPTKYDGPLCWIPHKVDNSCGGQVFVPKKNDKWGPFAGYMLHLSYGKCRMFLVLQENVGGTDQAGVVQFDLPPFASGGMRGRFSPFDGQLWVTGLKGWQTSGARDGCLQRVRYTGKKVYMPSKLNVTKTGVKITFNQPLDREVAVDPDSWHVEQWNYRWTKGYGSPHFSVKEPDKKGQDPVTVNKVELSKDGKVVTLTYTEEVKPVMQMMIKYSLDAADGELVEGAIYNTIHTTGK